MIDFNKKTVDIAKDLLGCYIIHDSSEGITLGKIVETEAYLASDPASHSFKGKTKRNEAMFGKPGTAYVYFTYGMYYCFNIVTNKEGIGEAVLIRAIEPIEGIDLMKKRRNVEENKLTNGPAKLVIALGITKEHNKIDLLDKKSPLRIETPIKKEKIEIVETKRIGISKGMESPHRFYIKGNPFVSVK